MGKCVQNSEDWEEYKKNEEKMEIASFDGANNKFSTLKKSAEYHWVKYKSLHGGIIARGGEF